MKSICVEEQTENVLLFFYLATSILKPKHIVEIITSMFEDSNLEIIIICEGYTMPHIFRNLLQSLFILILATQFKGTMLMYLKSNKKSRLTYQKLYLSYARISFITMYAVNNRLLIYENIVTCSRIIKLTFYCLLYIDQLKFQMSICVYGSQLVRDA